MMYTPKSLVQTRRQMLQTQNFFGIDCSTLSWKVCNVLSHVFLKSIVCTIFRKDRMSLQSFLSLWRKLKLRALKKFIYSFQFLIVLAYSFMCIFISVLKKISTSIVLFISFSSFQQVCMRYQLLRILSCHAKTHNIYSNWLLGSYFNVCPYYPHKGIQQLELSNDFLSLIKKCLENYNI